MATRVPDKGAGFGLSEPATFTIPTGATGSIVAAQDLGRNYAFLLLRCADCANIPALTTFGLELGAADADTLCRLYVPTGIYASPTLPTSGGFQILIPEAAGAQRVRVILSQNAGGGGSVVWEIIGVDAGVDV